MRPSTRHLNLFHGQQLCEITVNDPSGFRPSTIVLPDMVADCIMFHTVALAFATLLVPPITQSTVTPVAEAPAPITWPAMMKMPPPLKGVAAYMPQSSI